MGVAAVKGRVVGALRGRGHLLVVGFLINVCGGAIYAYSVFRKPLEALWGLSATQSGLPFLVFLTMFALGMALGGKPLESWGPRRTALLGGVLVGGGWLLAGFSPHLGALTLFYGVVAGLGVGLVYGCPLAVVGRWFPDRRGLALGLTVMGFGASPLLTAPLLGFLIARFGPLRTFSLLGAAFLGLLVLLALPLRYPPREGGEGPAARKRPERGAELGPRELLRTPGFYALWAAFALGCLAGLMAIGIAAPFGQEVARLSAGLSALAVSVFAVFNGVGRPLFGWLTDRISPRNAGALSFALVLLAALLLYFLGSHPAVYFLGFCLLWLNLGGWLAIAPTATAALFGMKHYGKNYGIVFTAYGAGAVLGNVLSGLLRDLTGSYRAVFPWVMGLALVGAGLALWGLTPPREPVPARRG